MSEFDFSASPELCHEFHSRCERISRLVGDIAGDTLRPGLSARELFAPNPSFLITYNRPAPPCYGDDWQFLVKDAGFGWIMEMFKYEYPTMGDSVIQTHYQFQSMAPMGDGRPLDNMFTADTPQKIYGSSSQNIRPKVFQPVTANSFAEYLDSEAGQLAQAESAIGILGIEDEVIPNLPRLTYRRIKFGVDTLETIDHHLDKLMNPVES